MKKFAGSIAVLFLLFTCCLSYSWAGDPEIRLLPGETARQELPLISEPEPALTDEAVSEPVPPIENTQVAPEEISQAEPADAVTDTEPQVEAEKVVAAVVPAVVISPSPKPKDILTQATELMNTKGLKNYKQALDLCEKAVKKDPNSYKSNWMAAKA